ncbi:ABC transporter ATP-binding protein [Pelomicrobium sp. G1]|uniref:ABC transporter ATP-binding protein n=1 Tax=unclassified Pelomicrobium TaxID=2815318 RepID=UPI003F757C27
MGKVYARGDRPEVVLRKCSFDIDPGKLTVLIGPSGCGKSTLVKLIAGYEKPSLGEITIDGDRVERPGPDRIVVFQETALFPWMSLLDNVAYGPIQKGIPADSAREEAIRLLAKVGLKGFEDRFPEELSGGMQRRAEVARALINKPRLMLLDEPFRGLDHMTRGLMQEYFLGLFEENHMTTLFVTSEVEEAIFLADRLVILSYKPTAVKAVIDVPLPRPREFHMLTSDIYADLKDQALGLLYEEALKGFVKGTAAAKEMERLVAMAKGMNE